MMSTAAALEIHVHLEDGRVTKFVQDDVEIAHRILEAIHPSRLFTAPQLLIGSDRALTAFQPRLVVRVDVLTELRPDWPTAAGALDTREITEDEFAERSQPYRNIQHLPSLEIVIFGEWEMANGARIFLQTHMTGLEEKRLPVEISMSLQKVMTSGGLLVRGRTGGYVILNPASLVRLTTHVGLQGLPANALPMTRLID